MSIILKNEGGLLNAFYHWPRILGPLRKGFFGFTQPWNQFVWQEDDPPDPHTFCSRPNLFLFLFFPSNTFFSRSFLRSQNIKQEMDHPWRKCLIHFPWKIETAIFIPYFDGQIVGRQARRRTNFLLCAKSWRWPLKRDRNL